MSGLGKGLGSLIPKTRPSLGMTVSRDIPEAVHELSVELIDPNPYQPRDTFTHGPMQELTESVRKHGILEPLLVVEKGNGRFDLIAGERRLRAAKAAGLRMVPVVVRYAEDLEKLELAMIENLLREDLNPIEEAEGFRELVDGFNLTQEEVAKKVGRSREVVANSVRLLSLLPEIQQAIASGVMSAGHGRVLLSIEDPKERLRAFNTMRNDKLTVRDAERLRAGLGNHARSLKDPAIASQERVLGETLGTKVTITNRKGRGKITIEFYSQEELGRIISQIRPV